MPVLYYWKPENYSRDRAFGFSYHLNQNSPAMAGLRPGDNLWAFTRRARDGLYVLAAELVTRAVTRNPLKYRYGRYRVWGDLARTRYFNVDVGPNAEPLIRALNVPARAVHLGLSFQGHAAVRTITEGDHQLLSAFARDLPELEPARIYPEDEFEARLIHGETARVLVVRESLVEYSRRLAYLYESVDIRRARRNVEHLQQLYAGRCQLCRYDPRDRYGHFLCHGHHIQWLSRGDEDAIENMVLICPNHHSAVHRDDAAFDYATLAFSFSNGLVERVELNEHLPMAS